MDEIRQVWGGEVMDGIECVEEDLVVYAVFDGQPVELVKNGGDVGDGRGFGDDAGCSVLDQLDFMEEFVGETEEKGVTVIEAGGDQRMDQDGSVVGGE